jgi:hypothetical protein
VGAGSASSVVAGTVPGTGIKDTVPQDNMTLLLRKLAVPAALWQVPAALWQVPVRYEVPQDQMTLLLWKLAVAAALWQVPIIKRHYHKITVHDFIVVGAGSSGRVVAG